MGTLEAITPFFTAAGLASTRIGAMMMAAPIFQSASIPSRLKGALVLVLSILVVLRIGPLVPVTPDGLPIDPMSAGFLLSAVVRELIAGALMGVAASIVFAVVQFAGEMMGMQMGLAAANIVDPTTRQSTGLIAQLLNIMAVLIFLAIDGHLFMLRALFESFHLVPLGGAIPDLGGMAELFFHLGTDLFTIGLSLCLPILCVVLFVNVGLAMAMRAVPQINIFAVGFVLTIGIGFMVLLYALPSEGNAMVEMGERVVAAVRRVSHLLGGP